MDFTIVVAAVFSLYVIIYLIDKFLKVNHNLLVLLLKFYMFVFFNVYRKEIIQVIQTCLAAYQST